DSVDRNRRPTGCKTRWSATERAQHLRITARRAVILCSAVCTDILHFRARVLAVYGQGYSWATLTRDMVLAVCSSDRTVQFSWPSLHDAQARGAHGRRGGQSLPR